MALITRSLKVYNANIFSRDALHLPERYLTIQISFAVLSTTTLFFSHLLFTLNFAQIILVQLGHIHRMRNTRSSDRLSAHNDRVRLERWRHQIIPQLRRAIWIVMSQEVNWTGRIFQLQLRYAARNWIPAKEQLITHILIADPIFAAIHQVSHASLRLFNEIIQRLHTDQLCPSPVVKLSDGL